MKRHSDPRSLPPVVFPVLWVTLSLIGPAGVPGMRGARASADERTTETERTSETVRTTETVRVFLGNYCADCHADGASEGHFDLGSLQDDLGDVAAHATWVRLWDRVAAGEMPPADAEQPPGQVRSEFTRSLGQSLAESHRDRRGTVLRRLNRREYENTLNDLFGTRLSLASMLPEDGRSEEFDTVGEALEISDVQLERYLQAIDRVLEEAVEMGPAPAQPETRRASYAETRGADKFLGNQWLLLDDGAVVFFRRLGYPSGMLREANTARRGRYRIRITGYAYQSNRAITFAVGATTFARGAEKPTFGFYSLPPPDGDGNPTTIELEAWIEERYMIEVTPFGISDDHYEIKRDGIENYRGPGLAILGIELEGPLAQAFPSRGHRLLFDGLDRREIEPRDPAERRRRNDVPRFEIVSEDPERDVRRVLHRVAEAAFRRPVTAAIGSHTGGGSVSGRAGELRRYVQLFRSEREAGQDIESALKTAVAAIFCSPDFLFLREPEGRLDDHALAARLAYLLTRTTPDGELRRAADEGRLAADPAELDRHVARLIGGTHFSRFVEDFTDAWLDLREIEFTSPDRNLYPEFDPYLQDSMIAETRSFFRELVRGNHPVRNLLRPAFAMLNERLAEHYGIEGVNGPEIRPVPQPPGSVRGGLLGQASVLKVTANGTNTSPVVRGVWVSERILGFRPSPPPPSVPGVEPDIRGTTTLREQLARHRDTDDCRGCHAVIDPPGFALESFDPIGGWRDRYRSLGEGEPVSKIIDARKVRYKRGLPVDASGVTADGFSFAGFREFRDGLCEDESRLARTVVTKLLTFGTGREMGFSDRESIESIVRKAAGDGYRIQDLIYGVVRSEPFQTK